MSRSLHRSLANAVFAAAVGGCGDPAVDAVVAWVEAIDDGRGVRKLQVYERGERYALDIKPEIAGSGVEQLRMEIDSRGEGIAVSGESLTRYVSLTTNRQPTLTRDDVGGQPLSEWFRLTRNGDALLRGFESDVTGIRQLMPTTSPQAGEVVELEPPELGPQNRLIEASDAPVVFWVRQFSSLQTPHSDGPVEAILYPSDHGGDLPTVDEVRVLARGEIHGATNPEATEQRVGEDWCPGRTCVSPDGRSVVVRAEPTFYGVDVCTFAWWRWEDADPANPDAVVPPVLVTIEDVCPEIGGVWSLFAQIGHHTIVLDDNERIYVVDLGTREVKAGPKLWDNSGAVRLADRGRALLLVSSDSQVTRVDANGPRLLSTEAHPCLGPAFDVTASPSGYWVARSCNGDGTFIPADTGEMLRLSSLGLEAFAGIPMRPLAIDDEGNILLYSYDTDDEDPRGLFVLGAEGRLDRIDELEPQPAFVTDGDGDQTFFAVQALRP